MGLLLSEPPLNPRGPCMCGALDCRSCGPAQGYEVPSRDDERDPDEWLERRRDEELTARGAA